MRLLPRVAPHVDGEVPGETVGLVTAGYRAGEPLLPRVAGHVDLQVPGAPTAEVTQLTPVELPGAEKPVAFLVSPQVVQPGERQLTDVTAVVGRLVI